MQSPFPDSIAKQILEGAARLLLLRKSAVVSPRHNLESLCRLDGRIEASLAGVLEFSAIEIESRLSALSPQASGVLALRAFYWANCGKPSTLADLAEEAAATGGGKAREEFLTAIEWSGCETAHKIGNWLIGSSSPGLRELGLCAYTLHQIVHEEKIKAALAHEHPGFRGTGIDAVGNLGLAHLAERLTEHLGAEDKTLRLKSCLALARFEHSERCLETLHAVVREAGPYASDAAFWLGAILPGTAWYDWMKEATRRPASLPLAFVSAIGQGDVRIAGWLLHKMGQAQFAALSCEAFSTLTGLDIEKAGLKAKSATSQAQLAGGELPVPDAERVGQWWKANEARFSPHERWFMGEPVCLRGLHQALVNGNQKQRHWAGLLLGRVSPDKPLFPVTAPGYRQKKLLG